MRRSPPEPPSADGQAVAVRDAVLLALRTLGHPDVSVASGRADADPTTLYEAEVQAIAGSVLTRQREFAAGRLLARKALAALGAATSVIPRGRGGQPLWPKGFTGSITHGGGIGLAVASGIGAVRGIGVDVEPAEPLEPSLWSTVCSTREIERLRRTPHDRAGMVVARLFSAKEAGFKSQFPTTGLFIEFDAATVEFEPECEVFEIRIPTEAQALLSGRTIRGAITETAGLIVTVAVV